MTVINVILCREYFIVQMRMGVKIFFVRWTLTCQWWNLAQNFKIWRCSFLINPANVVCTVLLYYDGYGKLIVPGILIKANAVWCENFLCKMNPYMSMMKSSSKFKNLTVLFRSKSNKCHTYCPIIWRLRIFHRARHTYYYKCSWVWKFSSLDEPLCVNEKSSSKF